MSFFANLTLHQLYEIFTPTDSQEVFEEKKEPSLEDYQDTGREKLLTAPLIAQIHATHYIAETPIEGYYLKKTLEHFLYSLKNSSIAKIKSSPQLKELFSFCLEVEQNVSFFENLHKIKEKLKNGDRLLLPAGWCEHAMLMDIKGAKDQEKNELVFDVLVFTTGAGNRYVKAIIKDGLIKKAPFLHFRILAGAKFEFFLHMILALNAEGHLDPHRHDDKYFFKVLFTLLGQPETINKYDFFPISLQRSGNCTEEVLHAYCRFWLCREYGEEEGIAIYKQFMKLEHKFLSFVSFFKKNSSKEINLTNKILFERGVCKQMDSFNKLQNFSFSHDKELKILKIISASFIDKAFPVEVLPSFFDKLIKQNNTIIEMEKAPKSKHRKGSKKATISTSKKDQIAERHQLIAKLFPIEKSENVQIDASSENFKIVLKSYNLTFDMSLEKQTIICTQHPNFFLSTTHIWDAQGIGGTIPHLLFQNRIDGKFFVLIPLQQFLKKEDLEKEEDCFNYKLIPILQRNHEYLIFEIDRKGALIPIETIHHLFLIYIYLCKGYRPKYLQEAAFSTSFIGKQQGYSKQEYEIFRWIFKPLAKSGESPAYKRDENAVPILLKLLVHFEENLLLKRNANRYQILGISKEEYGELLSKLLSYYFRLRVNHFSVLNRSDEVFLIKIAQEQISFSDTLKAQILSSITSQVFIESDLKINTTFSTKTVQIKQNQIEEFFVDSIIELNDFIIPKSLEDFLESKSIKWTKLFKNLKSSFCYLLYFACQGTDKEKLQLQLALELLQHETNMIALVNESLMAEYLLVILKNNLNQKHLFNFWKTIAQMYEKKKDVICISNQIKKLISEIVSQVTDMHLRVQTITRELPELPGMKDRDFHNRMKMFEESDISLVDYFNF